MKRQLIFPTTLFYLCAAMLLGSCDATIHEYPDEKEKDVDFTVQLNADRTPPTFYKQILYDADGHRTESTLEADASPAYLPDDRLLLRFIVEVRDNQQNDSSGKAAVVARRELDVDNDALPPQADVHFTLPAGGDYTAVAWCDYVPVQDPVDWYFNTSSLTDIEEDTEQRMQVLHHKNAATGLTRFRSAPNGMTLECAGVQTGTTRAATDTLRADRLVPVYMTRPAGRLRLYADDLEEFRNAGGDINGMTVVIVYHQYVSTAYDALGQDPCRWISTRQTVTHPSVVDSAGHVCLAYDYVLVDSEDETHVLADFYFLDADGNELSHTTDVDVPLRRNRETVISARFLTKDIGEGNVHIDETFDGEHVVVINE